MDGREEEQKQLNELRSSIEKLALTLERSQIGDYISLLQQPRKLLYLNFLAGLARGVGSAIGWTVLAAVTVFVLNRLVSINLPVIGDFIADLVRMVQSQLAR